MALYCMPERNQMLLINFYSVTSFVKGAFHMSPITNSSVNQVWSLLLRREYLNLCSATLNASLWLISILGLPNIGHSTFSS